MEFQLTSPIKFQLTSVYLFTLSLITLASALAFAQPAPNSVDDEYDEPIAEKINDPTSTLTQVRIKDIYTPAEYGTNAQPNTIQFRSVLAIHPSEFIPLEQLIRPTLKVVTEPDGKGYSTTTGYDDMDLLDLFVMPWPNSHESKFRWGLGPYFIFPTSSTNLAGNGAWQLGPAAAFSYRGIPGLNISALMQQATSFAYTSSHSTAIASFTFQPLLSYQLGRDWYLKSSDATWTINQHRHTSTTIPLSAGFGKVWKFSDGFALDTSLSGEWMLYRQFSSRTEQFTVNFEVTLLFPKFEF